MLVANAALVLVPGASTGQALALLLRIPRLEAGCWCQAVEFLGRTKEVPVASAELSSFLAAEKRHQWVPVQGAA